MLTTTAIFPKLVEIVGQNRGWRVVIADRSVAELIHLTKHRIVIKGSVEKVGYVWRTPPNETWIASQSFVVARLHWNGFIADPPSSSGSCLPR